MEKKRLLVVIGIIILLVIIRFAISLHVERRPTNFIDTLSMATNEQNAYDNDYTTNASHYMDADANIDYISFNTTGFGTETINEVNLTFEVQLSGSDNDQWALQYSDDGGTNWYDVRILATGDTVRTNFTLTITEQTAGEDGNWTWAEISTDLQARVVLEKEQAGDAVNLDVFEIWIDVDYNEADLTAPSVALVSPGDDSFITTSSNTFTYYVSDSTGIENCSLLINGSINSTNVTSEITNGDNNDFYIDYMGDGYYNWSVKCSDNSPNYNSNTSYEWLVKVDTTSPSVYLESPANNTLNDTHNTIWFFYNVSDNMTTVESCSLIIDGTIDQSTPVGLVDEGVTHNFSSTLTNAQHNWSVNCTDSNNWEGYSKMRNITIDVITPMISTDKGSYEQGETVIISGENWNPDVNVTLNLTWADGTNDIWNVSSDGVGEFVENYYINYSSPLGKYNITAFEPATPGNNFTMDFDVIARYVSLDFDRLTRIYKQGEYVWIYGTGFAPNGTVNLTWDYIGGTESLILGANLTGGINKSFNLSFTEELGIWNFSAIDQEYVNLNATNNFTVEQRIATIATDKSIYIQYENVIINGSWYTPNGTVRLIIKDVNSGGIPQDMPNFTYADFTGNISFIWNTSDACIGNYSIIAQDLNNSNLNATTYFNITGQSLNSLSTPIAIAEGDGDAVTLSSVQTSNDVYESLALVNDETDYLEVNFTNSIASGNTITSVVFNIEHYEDSKTHYLYTEWYNGTAYQNVTCPLLSTITTEANQTCELVSYIDDVEKTGNISLRVYFFREPGGGDTYIDYLSMNVTYSGQDGCSPFGGVAPIVDTITISPSPIDLLAGTSLQVQCNATFLDFNGPGDIVSVNATFFHTQTNTSIDPDDKNSHYTNSSCLNVSQDGDYVDFVCTFDVWYYANNGSWTCNVTAIDTYDLYGTGTENAIVNPLYAINISLSTLDYGNLAPGQTTPNAQELVVNITNEGNMDLNLSVYGYGTSPSDGLAMNCTFNNISIENERYDTLPNRDFDAQMTALTNNDLPSGIPGLSILQRIHDNDNKYLNSTNSTYWKIRIPTAIDGFCNGTVVFSAVG